MSSPSKQRAGKERIESLGIPKSRWSQWWRTNDKTDLAVRVWIVLAGGAALLILCQTWRPPFAFREGMIPARELITRVRMEVLDESRTEVRREQARRQVRAYYQNRPQPLQQLVAQAYNELIRAVTADSYDEMSVEQREAFSQFYEADETDEQSDAPEQRFSLLKSVLTETKENPDSGVSGTATDQPKQKKLDAVEKALQIAVGPLIERGLLNSIQHTIEQGDQYVIRVYRGEQPDKTAQFLPVSDVRVAEVETDFRRRLKDEFRVRFDGDDATVVADMIADWFMKRLPEYETLTYDDGATEKARQLAAAGEEPVMTTYFTGKTTLADAGKPIGDRELALLRQEWNGLVEKMRWTDKLARVAAYTGMITALCLLCGSYIWFEDDRSLLRERWRLAKLILLMVTVIVVGYHVAQQFSRVELIPLVLGSMIAAVVYGRELALLLSAAASVSLTLFLGAQMSELVVMVAACTTCTLLVGRIRTRTHLLSVGAISAAFTMATVVGVGVVTGQTLSGGEMGREVEPLYRGPQFDMVIWGLLQEAFWVGCCIVVSAAALTPFLPLIEKGFGVQTDLSLLELGDASHPLLRRLAQRAPGTYNHSINVASIAEAAADAIGANGLLVRVGAYFHDIGKMFKPEYFIENQSGGVNQHDTLQPAMSTLVIIAHVKDGADLARSHHLPEPIIDFILQHHGTTLVEYFYREAARRSEEDPNRESVSDKDFRYPGPKPQSLEAAVLMMADTVESAGRTLVDPTPARIQGLVDSIAQKKVADGQFDECGLTFRQLHRVRQSLVKSLTAIYHARVKYPGQQSA